MQAQTYRMSVRMCIRLYVALFLLLFYRQKLSLPDIRGLQQESHVSPHKWSASVIPDTGGFSAYGLIAVTI